MRYKLERYVGGVIDKLKVLSYNIGWEGMEDKVGGITGCNQSGNGMNMDCKNNVKSFIESHQDKHIIALQEASQWEYIIKDIDKKYNYINWFPSEDQITLWDSTVLELDDTDNLCLGWLKNTNKHTSGRPFTMLFFKGDICFINLHNGHNTPCINYNDFNFSVNVEGMKKKYIHPVKLNGINTAPFLSDNHKGRPTIKIKINGINTVDDLLNKNSTLNIQQKLDTYQIIIAGDFNCDPNFTFNNRNVYGNNTIKTCCDTKHQSNTDKRNAIYPYADHILTTNIKDKTPTTVLKPSKTPASDHLPVYREVILEKPLGIPSGKPLGNPSGIPSGKPLGKPLGIPLGIPSGIPSGKPLGIPSGIPSGIQMKTGINIGYDFDGVLHKEVLNTKEEIQQCKIDKWWTRHPSQNGITEDHSFIPTKPFQKIIDQIKDDYSKGNTIYIVTARDIAAEKLIKDFLENQNISYMIEKIICTNGGSKYDAIKNTQIKRFYDDTPRNLESLKSLGIELFLAIPDTEEIIQIKNQSIQEMCNMIIAKKSVLDLICEYIG